MYKLVKELEQHLNFKNTTDIGDIVVIAAKEPQMLLYAHVTDIEADTTRKDEWWNVRFSVLSIPIQEMIWTLRTPQMSGEIFTMGGEERFVKAIEFKTRPKPVPAPEKKEGSAKVTPFRRVK